MNYRHWRMFTLLLIAVLSVAASAQLKTEGISFGLGVGGTIGDTDFGRDDEDELGITFNPYLRHAIAGPVEGQINATILGKISRSDYLAYETTFNSVDYRLLLRLFSASYLSGYVYGGVGAMQYNVEQIPVRTTAGSATDGTEAYVPYGGGFQIRLSEKVSLDISGGYFQTFSDELNTFISKDNDGLFAGQAGLTWTRESGSADPDMDGLTNNEEKEIGTDKKLNDTDGDGLSDGEEFRTHMTDPLMNDTDNDGLNDSDEVAKYNTDPRKSDSDGDQLSDRDEALTHNTNPLKADSDDDGLTDNEELNTHGTNPLNADMDGDGLTDGEEVLTHKTDPRAADTDGDGLDDRAEVAAHNTDPLNADSDQGTVNDGAEVARGTNPLDAGDDIILEVEEGAPIVLDGVTFASGKADLTPNSEEILDKALNTLNAYADMVVEIRGYTDASGSRAFNVSLSQKRAEAVRAWLIDKGVDAGRIIAKGFGPDNPIAPNDTAEGRAQNRRIEFYRVK